MLLYLRKRCQWAGQEEIAKLEHMEVCPKAMELTSHIAKRISSDGGGALIIDYGKNEIISDSLQVRLISPSVAFYLEIFKSWHMFVYSAQMIRHNLSNWSVVTLELDNSFSACRTERHSVKFVNLECDDASFAIQKVENIINFNVQIIDLWILAARSVRA